MRVKKNIAISETGFIFNPITGESFSTNGMGHEILRKLQSGNSIEELTTYIKNAYSVDQDTVEKDLADFLLVLKIHHIITDNYVV